MLSGAPQNVIPHRETSFAGCNAKPTIAEDILHAAKRHPPRRQAFFGAKKSIRQRITN